jgi:hypothetical protein
MDAEELVHHLLSQMEILDSIVPENALNELKICKSCICAALSAEYHKQQFNRLKSKHDTLKGEGSKKKQDPKETRLGRSEDLRSDGRHDQSQLTKRQRDGILLP